MKNTSGKAANRYYQIDGLTPRGATVVTVFVKADNIAQVRNYLKRAGTLYRYWVTEGYEYGHFDGKILPTFTSRAEAFDFMLAERVAKGDDYCEAVEKADKFADIITKNKKLPATPPKPKNAIEQTVCYIEQVASVKREHPEVWDLVIGGISGLLGGFIANKGTIHAEELAPAEIDFDNIN